MTSRRRSRRVNLSKPVNLVPSLLQAIVRINGEVLVMHPGDKPYVVAPSGQVELASRGLTLDAVTGVVMQLLPPEVQDALDDVGAVQYTLPVSPEFPHDRFTVVVARGASDIWAEIRRKRRGQTDKGWAEIVEALPPPVNPTVSVGPERESLDAEISPAVAAIPPVAVPQLETALDRAGVPSSGDSGLDVASDPQLDGRSGVIPPAVAEVAKVGRHEVVIRPDNDGVKDEVSADWRGTAPETSDRSETSENFTEPTTRIAGASAVVLPMSRNGIRAEPPPEPAFDPLSSLERLLRTAAARGASTLYLSTAARPSVRVDGQLQSLDSEPVHTSNDVISLLLTLMPERGHESLRTGAATEWICDIEDVGRVRCMSFNDHRGPGGVFRLMPNRIVSADQLGLPREVQSLALEPGGLVLVVGRRSSGKRTLISALVDLINRSRRHHVITVEREVNIVHERGSSFVSQREVRGGDDEALAAARAALREDPDVLVLEQIRNGPLMDVTLEAAASGHLIIGGVSGHNVAGAIDRIINMYAPDSERHVQLALADNLRGVVAQVLLPKIGGGRIAVREILLNTPAVASVIAEGRTSQLPMAIEGGRRSGMVPLTDSLAGYVESGVVDIQEAYRHVADRPAFVAALKRRGVDTSVVERFA
jgi:twitching motility protein PilT